MISLIQRVSEASVTVDGEITGQIGRGLLALVAVQPDDTPATVKRMADRVLTYRVFPDAEDRMNRSLLDEGFELLLVPQFTLAAETHKGMRPGFSRAADPERGRALFDYLVERARGRIDGVQSGGFGAHMRVSLTNDGPVTFWLRVAPGGSS